MRIGIPREIKEGERRVALLPVAVASLVGRGHELRVEAGAGAGVGCADADYANAGAALVTTAGAWDADLVVKVKELLAEDVRHISPGLPVFAFHHLPGEPERVRELARREVTAIAFEMIRDSRGCFPLLAPMSVMAGRMAVQIGARLLGRDPERVLVLGAGHAGLSAASAATALHAQVVVLTRSASSRQGAMALGMAAQIASPEAIARESERADLVVGAVFVQGQPTPKLLSRPLVRRMRRGAVIVDVSIDAGGVAETSRPTTHANPTYVEEGVVHYCVGNIPAAAPAEAAAALSDAVLPYLREIAARGVADALRSDPALREGVLLWRGRVNHAGIAAQAGLPYTPLTLADLA